MSASVKALVILLLFNLAGDNNCNTESEGDNAIATNATSCTEIAKHAHECPTWFVPRMENGSTVFCECGPGERYDVRCDENKNQTRLNAGRCMTFNSSTNITYLGWCPYNTITRGSQSYTILPQNINGLNDFMCGGSNRTGLLCSQCQDGLGPAVLSYTTRCVVCFDSRYGWLLYLCLTMLPTTILCVIIIMFRFDATSASIKIFIIVCQLYIAWENYYMYTQHLDTTNKAYKFFALTINTFYGFWNLDFFRYLIPPFCISSQMTTMQVVALDYTVALYPLILTTVVYYFIEFHDKGYRVCVWIWKPFRRFFIHFRKTWNLKGSVVNAFATFLLLSISKLITVSRNIFHSTDPQSICGERLQNRYLLYFDTSMEYLGTPHLAFAIPAIFITVIFIILPTLLLLFYQNKYFQKLLGCLRLQLTLLHELVKIIQSCYKDGTGETRDCRWFAGVYLLLRIFVLMIIGVKLFSLWFIFGLLVAATLLVLFQPYKNEIHNKMNIVTIHITVICVILINYSLIIHYIPLWPIGIAALLPLLYFICYVIYNIFIHTSAHQIICCAFKKIVTKFKKQPEKNEAPPYRLLHPEKYPPLKLSPNTKETLL